MNKEENAEPLLHWLQEFYVTKIAPLKCRIGNSEIKPLLPEFISDRQIKNDYWSFQKVPDTPGLLKIYTIGDPGWSLHFGYHSLQYATNAFSEVRINTGKNLVESDGDEWLSGIRDDTFYIAWGPLYLTIVIESFRSYIDQEPFNLTNLEETREGLAYNNTLLEWIENFYFSCCERLEGNHPRYYVPIHMSMISAAQGWVIVFALDDIVGGEGHFEPIFIEEEGGTIKCYKTESDLFIIRTHFRGLIKGLTIFKEWTEANFIESTDG